MESLALIQLPDDAKAVGYRQTRPYHYEQVFESAFCNFKGTEREFLKAGHAYSYVQIEKYTRICITTHNHLGE